MKRLTLLIAVVLTAGFANAEDRRPDKTKLTVMCFNAEFLWDGVSPEQGSSDIEFPWRGDQTKAEAHMNKIAEVIKASNPDIVCLVEVENLDALTTLNTKFLAGQGYKPYLEEGGDTFTGQDVGLLTRIDPDSFAYDDREGFSGNVSKRVTKNFVADFEVNDTSISMVGLHFLANPSSSGRRLQRQAQADAIRRIAIEKQSAGREVILLGDWNDYDDEVPDHLGSVPISKVMLIGRMMETGNFDDDLVNVAKFVDQAERYTAHWDKDNGGDVDEPDELTSIDHILVSPTLADMVTNVTIPHAHSPLEVSDHFPVVATIGFIDGGSPQPEPMEIDEPTRQQILNKIQQIERDLKELKELLGQP